MSKMDVHFSSEKMDWETPQDFFDELDKEFDFDVDVCANSTNRKCETWYGETPLGFIDGLNSNWYNKRYSSNVFWMNPPYGREIVKWMKKAYEESLRGCTVVCLVPSRTDTKWWHDYAMKGEIRFIKGRLKFGGHKNAAPFPSVVVIFRKEQV